MLKELNKDFKETAIGLIPEDWEVKKLGECSSISGDYGINAPAVKFSEDLPTYLRITDIDDDGNYSKENKVSVKDDNSESFILDDEDIVFARTGATVGKTYLHNKKENGDLVFAGFLIRFRTNFDILLPYYLKLYTNTDKYWNWVSVFSMRSGQPGINSKEYSNLKIPLPPLPEQKKIADCLSTWDSAIEKQNALINALTDRKKALMQQLLTGKKRLPGFSGEWKEVKLGDIGEISSAGVDKNIVEGEKPIRLLNFLDVYRRDFLYSHEQNHWVTANDYKIEKCSIKKGDVFFTPSSEVPNDIAISAVAMENFDNVVYSYHIVRFRIKEKWDLRYKAYAFKTDEFFKQAQRICDGSGQRYVISQNNFKNIKIKIPSLEEQTAIAEILATADRELQLQKEKLAQLQIQKKGLMQVLLTGKKRLLN